MDAMDMAEAVTWLGRMVGPMHAATRRMVSLSD